MEVTLRAFDCIPQIAAGSVVLRDLPAHTTAAGVPAKVLGVATEGRPSEEVDQNLRHVLYTDAGRQEHTKNTSKRQAHAHDLNHAQPAASAVGRQADTNDQKARRQDGMPPRRSFL